MSTQVVASRVAVRAGIVIVSASLMLGTFRTAPTHAEAPGSPSPPFDSPVEPVLVLRLVDLPEHQWNAGHRGIDLDAAVGASVRAPADGVVAFVGTVVNRGVVTVVHSSGLVSSFEPVAATVVAGQEVAAGDDLGHVTAESGHCGAETCVHWGVRRGGTYINPLDLLDGYGPIRLLPLGPDV